MQASKSNGHLANFDTFKCLTCDTTIEEQAAAPPTKPGNFER